MKAKLSFVSGMALGMLAGSRMGPELYRRVSSTASSLASNPQVRKGASTAGDRAAHAAKNAGASAAHQVKHAKEAVSNRFGDRWSPEMHSAANGSSHSTTGRFGDQSFNE